MAINMDSITQKAKEALASKSFQKKIDKKVDDAMLKGGTASSKNITIHGTSMAAGKFIEVLQNEIRSHAINSSDSDFSSGGLSPYAIDALINLEHGEPRKIGRNRYQIGIWFADDLHRESLYSDKYPNGIANIAALLNTGYDETKRVYGMWHGKKIPSLNKRTGAHFIDNAIRNYESNYASEYGVVDITVDDAYK